LDKRQLIARQLDMARLGGQICRPVSRHSCANTSSYNQTIEQALFNAVGFVNELVSTNFPMAIGKQSLAWYFRCMAFLKLLSSSACVLVGILWSFSLSAVSQEISVTPANQTVPIGAEVSWSALPAGPEFSTLQWQFGGTNILGATHATLRLSNAQFYQAGGYRVVGSNASGSVTSVVATLVVTPKKIGSLDRSFSAANAVTGHYLYSARFGGNYPVVDSIWVRPDQRIVISGNFTNVGGFHRLCVAQLHPDGTVDSGFQAPLELFYSTGQPVKMTPYQNNKLLIWASNLGASSIYPLVRLNEDGSRDSSFAPSSDVKERIRLIRIVGIEPEGTILVVGQRTLPSELGFVRLSNDGALLKDFAASLPQLTAVSGLHVRRDGDLVIWGRWEGTEGFLRLHRDGSQNGKFAANPPELLQRYPNAPNVFAPYDDSRVLIAFSRDMNDPVMYRVRLDGTLDPEFKGGPWEGGVFSLLVQPDGRILTTVARTGDWQVVRRNSDGSPDASFVTATVARGREVPGIVQGPYAMAWQDDGGIVIGGSFDRINGILRTNVARLVGSVPDLGLFSPIRLETGFRAYVPTVIGKTYMLEYRDSLGEAGWTAATSILGDGTVQSISDRSANVAQRFYRLRVE
jgi:uncharacterized delta-60 repeat protein